jgi:hypothetical protein
MRPVRESGKDSDATVNPDGRKLRLWRVRDLPFPGYGGVPTPSLEAKRNGQELAAERPVSSETHPADLGKLDGAVVLVEALEAPDVVGWQRDRSRTSRVASDSHQGP